MLQMQDIADALMLEMCRIVMTQATNQHPFT